jgi:hypothetical protein
MKKIMDGLYDRSEPHGTISGSGPGFEVAMEKFRARQNAMGRVGTWRKALSSSKVNDGAYIDPDWVVYNYGQDDET